MLTNNVAALIEDISQLHAASNFSSFGTSLYGLQVIYGGEKLVISDGVSFHQDPNELRLQLSTLHRH